MNHSHFGPALVAALLFPLALLTAKEDIPVYRDISKPQAVRIDDLISRMTLEEKSSMMANTTPGVPRLGIPKYDWWNEALHGVARAGTATVFPQAIGLAAMWDEPLQFQIARTIGTEARAKFNGVAGTSAEGTIYHGLTFWSPNINLFRDPRWGRGQETYGEDPFLTSRLGVAFVRGLQGDDPRYLQAAACAKHYAVHSGPEPLRHIMNVAPSQADLHESYLPAFEALVREAHAEIVMTAYNSLYGTPCSVSPLLYRLLSDWGFDGHVTSDCGSVGDLIDNYKLAADEAEAEAMIVKAGMNVRCLGETTGLVEAMHRGLLTETQIDRALRPLLRTMFRLGFFDPKEAVPFARIPPSDVDTPAHAALALQSARESMVLLKNDGLLPLKKEALHHVAVIGPNATSVVALLGNYNGQPSAPVTVLAGLKAALEPAGVRVDYAHGCDYAHRPSVWRPLQQLWFRGEYFANPELSGKPVVSRSERALCVSCNGHGANGGLPPGVPEKDVSARWNGELETTVAGTYQFLVRGRGGFRLIVGDKTAVDAWVPPPGGESSVRTITAAVPLGENASVPIRLEYLQGPAPFEVALEWKTPAPEAPEAEALQLAGKADLIVFVGGISAQLEGEEMDVDYDGYQGGDRLRIELPALQQQLLEKLHALGKPIVLVNLSGSAVALPWADAHLNAIVQAWYPGQAGGTAVADVLAGSYNPAGRLPVTFYRGTEDLPDFKEYSMANRTYRYFAGKPLYPFGHGLSYTTFAYSGLHASPSADGGIEATLTIANTGTRDGDEVVQLYAVPPAETHPREKEALCGFRRVHLAKGETATIKLLVPQTALRRWNTERGAYAVPGGNWTLHAGASASDIRDSVTFSR